MTTALNTLKHYTSRLTKKKIATTYDINTLDGLSRFMSEKGFTKEPDAIRFIVHTVLQKAGYIK